MTKNSEQPNRKRQTGKRNDEREREREGRTETPEYKAFPLYLLHPEYTKHLLDLRNNATIVGVSG